MANFAKFIIKLFLICLITCASEAAQIKEDYELFELGSLKLSNSSGALETKYYISLGTFFLGSRWDEAVTACGIINGSLVSIETEFEKDGLDSLLENFVYNSSSKYGVDYWTSGKYDVALSSYRWTSNRTPFPPWAAWGPSEPFPISVDNPVGMRFESSKVSTWRIPTFRNKFICEIAPPDLVVPCYSTNDLIIVLDSSGSVGSGNYLTAKQFVAELATGFTTHNESHIAFSIYSTNVQDIFRLDNALTPAEIVARIIAAPYHSTGTPTDRAIDAAVAQFASLGRAVPRNLVVLTDGQSDSPASTRLAAERALAAGIRSFAVGITSSVDMAELLIIAGGDAAKVFTAANWAELVQLLAPLSTGICP